MIVFLRRIPAGTKKYEISAFLDQALNGGLFTKSGRIDDIQILKLRDKWSNSVEYHGLVRIEPEAAAKRVIKMLNRKPINGKPINVREYFLRNWHNDRRLRMNHFEAEIQERRKSDRRRNHLEIERVDVNLAHAAMRIS
ncbi:MAG: RNA recognition motif domain-containing protein [Gammaproteobacteria bacterium]